MTLQLLASSPAMPAQMFIALRMAVCRSASIAQPKPVGAACGVKAIAKH
jgi:hypothetical protein